MATIRILRQSQSTPAVQAEAPKFVSSVNPVGAQSVQPVAQAPAQPQPIGPNDASARFRPTGDLFAGAAPLPTSPPPDDGNVDVGAGMALSGALGEVEAFPQGVAITAPAPAAPRPAAPAPMSGVAPGVQKKDVRTSQPRRAKVVTTPDTPVQPRFTPPQARQVAPAPAPAAAPVQQVIAPAPAPQVIVAAPAPQQPAPVAGQPEVPWQGKNVILCLPWYKTTNPMTAIAVAAFTGRIGLNRCGMVWSFGDAMIQNSRNKTAELFLQTNAEWSVWIDDDVIPPFGSAYHFRKECGLSDDPKDPYFWPDEMAGMNTIDRLISHNQPVVGGVYFGRRRMAPPMFAAGINQREAYEAAKTHADALVETDWVATGCLLVHRKVFTDMQAKFPELAPVPNRPQWDFFRKADDGGEDVGFCNRVRAMGYPIYADTGCQALHLGAMAYGFHNTISIPAGRGSESGLF